MKIKSTRKGGKGKDKKNWKNEFRSLNNLIKLCAESFCTDFLLTSKLI